MDRRDFFRLSAAGSIAAAVGAVGCGTPEREGAEPASSTPPAAAPWAAEHEVLGGAIDVLKQQGAVVVDPIDLQAPRELDDAELLVLLYEFKADLNAYLATLGPNVQTRTLAELIDFNERHKDREMPYVGQDLFVKANQKGPLTTNEYVKALATCRRLSRAEGIDRVMAQHRLDAIVAPTGGPAWTTDLVNGDHFGGGSSTLSAVAAIRT